MFAHLKIPFISEPVQTLERLCLPFSSESFTFASTNAFITEKGAVERMIVDRMIALAKCK